MLIISSQIDLNGERWFYPYKKPAGSKKKFTPEDEALFKLRLLVASSENPGTVAKLAMRQPFVLFKGLTFQKL
ncbi:hypothetical protein ACO0TU_07375, partial [Klebsiella pneumoniae]|nr:hypothetical protein [Klebsiella pneumoniae]